MKNIVKKFLNKFKDILEKTPSGLIYLRSQVIRVEVIRKPTLEEIKRYGGGR